MGGEENRGETWLGDCERGWLQRQRSPEPKPQDEEKMLLTDAGDEVGTMMIEGFRFSQQSTCYLTSAPKGGLQSRNPKHCNGIKLEKCHSQFYLARSQMNYSLFWSRKGENN